MRILLVLALLTGLLRPLAAEEPATESVACTPDGVAFGGYDVVSYRSPGGPLRGDAAISLDLDGVTYLFADTANRELFRADPRAYLPAYGGWCATTIAHGALRCPDYTNFKIEDGRLLFFEVTGFTNGRAVWDADPETYRRRADENFRRLRLR